MRAKFLLRSTISVLGMGLALYCSEAVADDVYVDLSVLDSLGTGNSPVINSAPLFPVVSSSPQFPEIKKVSAKKKSVKKSAPKKTAPIKKELVLPTAEIVKTPEEKLNIPAKEDVSVNFEKETAVSPAEKLADSPFMMEQDVPVQEEVSAAPVAPVEVKVEEIPENDHPAIMEPINGSTQLPSMADDIVDGSVTEKAEPSAEGVSSASDALPETSDRDVVASTTEESLFALTEKTPETAEEKKEPRPLIENAPYDAAPVVVPPLSDGNDILFAENSDELTEEDKQKIDAIIATFENPQVNKIAIYSYNLDTGKDSFYRKRMSLNRAVEVRSYLLNKGYKNFSIKVINIAEDSGKSNRVSIEELK